MYQVLARKLRPQTFEELVGQPHVARTLRNAIEAGRIAHAYLFAGVRGTGKTTVARILAKCLECEHGPTPSPCNECVPCREIVEGRSMDVLEMDAASRTSVEDVRELQEVIAYPPVRDRHKVLIIDEAHMLSKHAFNALLKTLEEPPPRIVFILATTEIHKLPPTILSRCQVFEFRRISPREVSALLRKVSDAEGIEISDRTLDGIARAGEGSVRDSLSVLERVLAFCGNRVSDEEALEVLGGVRSEVLEAMVRHLADRDAAGMLRTFDGIVDEGHDLIHFWSELIAVLRDLLLLRAVPGGEEMLGRPQEEARILAAASTSLSREDLTRAFHVLADLEPGLKSSSQPRFLFEAALVRLASLGAVRPIEDILASLESGAPAPAATRAAAPPPRGAAAPPPQKKKQPDLPVRDRAEARGSAVAGRTSPGASPATAPECSEELSGFVEAVARSQPMLAAALGQAASIVLDEGVLTIRFSPGPDVVHRVVEREENLAFLRECAARHLGKPVLVRVARVPSVSASAADSPAARREGRLADPAQAPERGAPPDRDALLERARSEPGVRKLLTEFGAQIVEIRPLDAPSPSQEEPAGGTPSEDLP